MIAVSAACSTSICEGHRWSRQGLRDSSEIPGAVAAIGEKLEEYGYSPSDRFAVELCVTEALANAIHHGNGDDSSKLASFRYAVDREEVWIEIEDEGPGFNPDDIPDPTDDEHRVCAGGRGVFLMRAFMTSVEFNASGNRVQMRRKRDTAC